MWKELSQISRTWALDQYSLNIIILCFMIISKNKINNVGQMQWVKPCPHWSQRDSLATSTFITKIVRASSLSLRPSGTVWPHPLCEMLWCFKQGSTTKPLPGNRPDLTLAQLCTGVFLQILITIEKKNVRNYFNKSTVWFKSSTQVHDAPLLNLCH